jgi:hypothetical protein
MKHTSLPGPFPTKLLGRKFMGNSPKKYPTHLVDGLSYIVERPHLFELPGVKNAD